MTKTILLKKTSNGCGIFLFATKAKWMLVIKATKFIRELYNTHNCTIVEFDKTYTYNVRGRNNRDTKHLIVMNYVV